jgi:GMP synthase-like glutamine amidotransferase
MYEKTTVPLIFTMCLGTFLPTSVLGGVPKQPNKNFEFGSFELSERRYKAAIELFDRVLVDEPENSLAYSERGRGKEKLKDHRAL